MDREKKQQIGERLALVRATKRKSQKAMGEELMIPWRTYQNYEMGSREVPVDFVMDYCDRLSIRPEWLINGEGGQARQSDFGELKPLILRIDQQAKETGEPLSLDALADVAIRLFRKLVDGQPVTSQDYQDYIDLKREI